MIIIMELTVFAGLAILLFIIEPIGSFIVFSIVFAAVYIFQWLTKKWLINLGGKRKKFEGFRIQAANEGLGGFKDAKLLGREAEFKIRYLKWLTLSIDAQYKHAALDKMPRLWLETVGVIGLMLLTVSVVLQTGDTKQIVPVIGAFAAAAFRILPSANRVLSAITSLRYAESAINTIIKDLVDKNTDVLGEKVSLDLAFCSEIQLDDVCYSYPNTNKAALSSVNILIKKNDTVGIIGASGAGKSTLIDVILGLLKPTSGRVLVDSVDIQTSLRGWQNKVGYVPQEIYLTDDTLRKNVAFGLPDELIDDKLLASALNSAKLADFVETLPNGIETLMGERGVRLSGGQKQRIGIARALYHNPSILVFDEAMSALDNDTEAEVMGAINLLRGSRTIIIIAHRLSTVQNCDRVYEVENGHVSHFITPKINSSV
jgi:ABC-type multidrug transport system fused ATPase/permease subunit